MPPLHPSPVPLPELGRRMLELRRRWPGEEVPGACLAGLFAPAGDLRAACAAPDEASAVRALAVRIGDEPGAWCLCFDGAPSEPALRIAAEAGVAIVVGAAAASAGAVAIAREHGLTLCAGPGALTVLAGSQRVTTKSPPPAR